jgi:hypothetical protein
MRSFLGILLLGSALAFAPACSSDPSNTGAGASGGGGSGGGSDGTCTEPTAVACSDQVIQQMNFKTEVAPGLINDDPDGAGFLSVIDATAGGAFVSEPDSYVYAKFTETGLQKVAISDEQSLDSMDWDIALRRYVVRINSGNSGPSCVAASRLPGTPVYDELTAAPDGLTYRKDEYFSDSCQIIPDGSGLEGSPSTVLSGYWSYKNCVKMTGNVYIVRLADGRLVKLTVASYYSPDVQEQCDTTDTIPMTSTGSAVFRVRWAFLP